MNRLRETFLSVSLLAGAGCSERVADQCLSGETGEEETCCPGDRPDFEGMGELSDQALQMSDAEMYAAIRDHVKAVVCFADRPWQEKTVIDATSDELQNEYGDTVYYSNTFRDVKDGYQIACDYSSYAENGAIARESLQCVFRNESEGIFTNFWSIEDPDWPYRAVGMDLFDDPNDKDPSWGLGMDGDTSWFGNSNVGYKEVVLGDTIAEDEFGEIAGQMAKVARETNGLN